MNPVLERDLRNRNTILAHTLGVATEHFDRQALLPPSRDIDRTEEITLPDTGWGAEAVLEFFRRHHAPLMANSAGPRYFGFVTGGSTPAAVAGDWLVSVYDQVMSGSRDSVAHALERQAIDFLLDLFGLEKDFKGTFVTGATMSNFVSLATARQWVGRELGFNPAQEGWPGSHRLRVLSGTPHSSIVKSLSMLGVGRNALVHVPALPGREAVDTAALAAALEGSPAPAVVVGNAGTVNTVDFDDLQAIAQLKQRHRFWFHVDAAFGGFARTSPRFAELAKGLELADSITIDAHKWLNVPYDAAMQFTRHRDLQVEVFQNNAAYLGTPGLEPDAMHLTPENSRRFRALPAWFTLLAYGRQGYRDIVERNCDSAFYLGEKIRNSTRYRLLAPVRMNVVCFTLATRSDAAVIRALLDRVRDDGQVFFTPTNYLGTPAIRAAISNWQTTREDIDAAATVLERLGEAVLSGIPEHNFET